jgi:hypothetical protein
VAVNKKKKRKKNSRGSAGKRYRTLLISGDLLLGLFEAGAHRGYVVVENAIPSGSKLVNVRHGWPNIVELVIESDSFSEVAEGAVIPLIEPALQSIA